MSIEFIKQNLKKFGDDNLITFLFDVITCGSIDYVTDFNDTVKYVRGDIVYYKDQLNSHHLYKCIVEESTVGRIMYSEWDDLLQSFRQPSYEYIVGDINIKEEVIVSTIANQNTFALQTPGVENGDYHIVVHHPIEGRLAATDFQLVGRNIILNTGLEISNIGEKLIIDLYGKN